MIKIKYHNTKEELVNLYAHELCSDPDYIRVTKIQKTVIKFAAFISTIIAIYKSIKSYLNGYIAILDIFFAILFFVIGIGTMFFYDSIMLKGNRKYYNKNLPAGLFNNTEDKEVTLCGDSMNILSKNSETTIKINELDSIKIINNYILLRYKRSTILFIPYDVFDTKEQRIEFENIIKSSIDAT